MDVLPTWDLRENPVSPLVATAIHNGHEIRDELIPLFAIDTADRAREEDAFTGLWADVFETRLIVHRSRFEVDLNRPRERAVYVLPEQSWGMQVWKKPPPPEVLERSLALYDAYYRDLQALLTRMVERFGKVILLDVHSYNYRREGPDKPPAPEDYNPGIIVGTSNMNRVYWSPVVETFIRTVGLSSGLGEGVDIRENIKFAGGWMARWVHQTFPERVCGLAVEFKKTYMDEWTGEPFRDRIDAISRALMEVQQPLTEALKIVGM